MIILTVNILINEKPDLIVITGDISAPNGTLEGYEEVLSLIKAPLGFYFVNGNWEYWSPIKDFEKIFSNTISDI